LKRRGKKTYMQVIIMCMWIYTSTTTERKIIMYVSKESWKMLLVKENSFERRLEFNIDER